MDSGAIEKASWAVLIWLPFKTGWTSVISVIKLYYIVLYYITLHCIMLYYIIVLYCIMLWYVILYCLVSYYTTLHCITLYSSVLHCITLYSIILNGISMKKWLSHLGRSGNDQKLGSPFSGDLKKPWVEWGTTGRPCSDMWQHVSRISQMIQAFFLCH